MYQKINNVRTVSVNVVEKGLLNLKETFGIFKTLIYFMGYLVLVFT